jgi:adenosylcobinamide-GDP ribazoletransferase
VLAIAALTITTGAFHEDGLADSADGLFGGATPERRLEIMKDSRIGSYGAAALILAFLLRVSLLAALAERAGAVGAAAALVAAAVWSRALGIHLLALDPPARAYGALATVGRPTVATAIITIILAATLAILSAVLGGFSFLGTCLALSLGFFATFYLRLLARDLIGGPTGDIAGAAQQLSEALMYLGLLLAVAR